jgi:hypothetical protein
LITFIYQPDLNIPFDLAAAIAEDRFMPLPRHPEKSLISRAQVNLVCSPGYAIAARNFKYFPISAKITARRT